MLKAFNVLLIAGKNGGQMSHTASIRGFASATGDLVSSSVASHSYRTHLSPTVGGPLSGRKVILEKLWHDFFSDPSQWWDHRSKKANPRYPDFKHKKKQQALWLTNKANPPWLEAKLAAFLPKLVKQDIFSWNVRLRKYVKAGNYMKAMDLFKQMQRQSITPDKFTFVPVLNACSSLLVLEEGRRVHVEIVKYGFEDDVFVGSCLVDMYAKCGSMEDARRVFKQMPRRDVVTWSAMILGCVKWGHGQEALQLFRHMQREGCAFDPVTFVGVLNACASMETLEEGRRVHEQIVDLGYDSDNYVANSLVDMYAKCGSMEDAQRAFDKMSTRTVVSWTALIRGYVTCGQGQKALELYRLMRQDRVDPNHITFVGVLNACASIGALEEGRRFHEQIIEKGHESNAYVANAVLDMYARCGSIEDARRLFNKMPTRDVVTWSTLIHGYVKCGKGHEALELSQSMQRDGVDLDPLMFVGLLNACTSTGALEEGRRFHEEIVKRGHEDDGGVVSCLVDMYAKCGSIEDAQRVFNERPTRDVVCWSAMLGGYCRHGFAKEALEHFERMCYEVEVDAVSFLFLLSACNHGGLLDEGMHYFQTMSKACDISPTLEHYACIIDLLGRAGHLHEAEDLIRRMPYEPDAAVWISLLGACRMHGNVEMGEGVARQVLEMDPGNAAGYVMLLNINAAAGQWDRVQSVHHLRLATDMKRTLVHPQLRCTP